MPSQRHAGSTRVPVRAASVGSQTSTLTGASTVRGLSVPGQQANAGTRMPPFIEVAFPATERTVIPQDRARRGLAAVFDARLVALLAAVVAGEDDQRSLRLPGLLDRLDDPADRVVHV